MLYKKATVTKQRTENITVYMYWSDFREINFNQKLM
jgi:hypothetical protein